MWYESVFFDIDGTLLWVEVDLAGYVEDVTPYAMNGPVSVERAAGPVAEAITKHIRESINYRTREALEGFMLETQFNIARQLGLDVPRELLEEMPKRRVHFRPYQESEWVLKNLRSMGLRQYAVSNWDVLLEDVLYDLSWMMYFDGVVTSAAVGAEKPASPIFEEALRLSQTSRDKVVHVGNSLIADVNGATACGLDAVLVDREGSMESPEPAVVMPELTKLPEWIGDRQNV